jgi:AbrB family looped-hinge helix DNA binding protein
MTENRPYYKTRLRARGQITLPPEIRDRLGIRDGDDVAFYVAGSGQIVVEPVRTIDPEQAWFWTERWQKMEREVQADIDAGRVYTYASMEEAIAALEKRADAES